MSNRPAASTGRWARLVERRRSQRGFAEASVLVVAGSLLAGVLFGTGLSRTAVDIGDGLTWFADDPTGEVIQVNPATGRPEARIEVGDAGDQLGVAQYDGRLIVTNDTTGELTSFDLASILASGSRRVTPGGATSVLHHDGQVFLVDRDRATLAAIDPVSTDTLGQLWQSPEGISDAVVDGRGTLWVVDTRGLLSELRWSASAGEFVTERERPVEHSGPGSVLVAHEEGVTLFGPDAGIVVQTATGRDDEVVTSVPRLSGDLLAPDDAPAGLVPVSSPTTGTVVIVSDGAVHEVDLTAVGCGRPERPAVFESTVFVPCAGESKVVRLAPDGQRAGDDIVVPDGGEPVLLVDDGTLLINVPGADQGVAVHEDGAVSSIVRYDDDTPTAGGGDTPVVDSSTVDDVAAQDALATPPPSPQPSQQPTQQPSNQVVPPTQPAVPGQPTSGPNTNGPSFSNGNGNQNGNGNGGNGNGTKGPTVVLPTQQPTHQPPQVPTTEPTTSTLSKPFDVVATSLPTGQVSLGWSYGTATVDAFIVQEVGATLPLARLDGAARKATLDVEPGTHRFTVTATRAGAPPATSNVTDEVTTAGRPDAPTGLTGTVVGSDSTTTATVSLSWTAPDDHGAAVTAYTVVAQSGVGDRRVEVNGTKASLQLQCADTYCDPGPVKVTVTARNSVGTSGSTSATLDYSGPTPPPPPSAGAQLVTGQDHAWSSPQEGYGTTTLTLAPPADWASWSGTCSWTHTGNEGGQTSGSIPCGARSLDVEVRTGTIRGSGQADVAHTIVFTATGRGGTSQSATFQWVTSQPRLCDTCAVP